MFSKAKRFDPLAPVKKTCTNKKPETNIVKPMIKNTCGTSSISSSTKKNNPTATPIKSKSDLQSECNSVKSVKSFVTPKLVKRGTKISGSNKKSKISSLKNTDKAQDDLAQAQEVEIRNKDYTIAEYIKIIEELKDKISVLQKKTTCNANDDLDSLDKKLSKITLNSNNTDYEKSNENNSITDLNVKIIELDHQCNKLEQEVSTKQVELTMLEEVITIRDSLCKDLQDKLTIAETDLEETRQRLEMVKGHHALALEANESIRREYKTELEALKLKMEEEKQVVIAKSKAEQENIKYKYLEIIESIKIQLTKEKDEMISELQQQLTAKDMEMKAKLEQIDEATHEKLKLCEIQFEERSRTLQEEWTQQQNQLQYLEKESKDLKYKLGSSEQEKSILQKEINNMRNEVEIWKSQKLLLTKEMDELRDESKKKLIDFENKVNKLTVEVDKVTKEKNKFEMSLSVTRDIVHVLTMRLRESDSELEHLESKVLTLNNAKELLENELTTYKNTLNNTAAECNEYKEALVNILKSKAALAKEHTRIMEHNVSLIESLQNVEKEAYRELGSIKSDLIEDVELLKKESNSQIQILREEVEKKRVLCEMATEHAGQATAAAEQSRVLLSQAAAEIAHLEADNKRLQQQIQDQQSLVVELSLLRQENEELTMTMAKQTSILDKMKKDADQIQYKQKSPSVMRKTHKTGKENLQHVISPLRERNH